MIGGKFAPLTIVNNENANLDSTITTYNSTVTETLSEILCKHCQKKKPWVTADMLDLCDKRRELIKKTFAPEGYNYREVNNNVKRRTKRANENWIGEQCSETEENLRKNDSKRAYHLVKNLTTVKQWKATTIQDRPGRRLTEERETLNRWTEKCFKHYKYKTKGDLSVLYCSQTDRENDHPILRKEFEATVQLLGKGKSAGVDNISAELVQAGGQAVITALTTICNEIWQRGEWPTPVLTHCIP